MNRIVLSLALLAAVPLSAQTPSFSSRVESVRVDVLVMQNDRPVTGLGPNDFDLRDNGVPQKIELASYDEIPLNVVLALDLSYSPQNVAPGGWHTLDVKVKGRRATIRARPGYLSDTK